MSRIKEKVDLALSASDRGEIRGILSTITSNLSLPQIQRLTRHLESLSDPLITVRLAVIHTYTSDLLDPYLGFLSLMHGLDIDIYHAPYGVTVQEATSNSGLVRHAPDLTLLLFRWEDLDPRLSEPVELLSKSDQQDLASQVSDSLSQKIKLFRTAVGGHILVTLLPPLRPLTLGLHDINTPGSERIWQTEAKCKICEFFRQDLTSVTLLDLDECLMALGREHFFDLRWWYSSRFPFSPAGAMEVARHTIAYFILLKSPKAKVIALDADNTLWGGIVGEDGISGIALGHDYPGNVFVAFQRRLLDFQKRGFLLALCSKNNRNDVFDILRNHPQQILREKNFAAMRINWEPKPANLRSLAEELNLGLESFVFADDSDHECLMVRKQLPQVEVVQVPKRMLDIPTCLDSVARLEILNLTPEDQRKTELYAQERKRRELSIVSTDIDSYLSSLKMRIDVGIDSRDQISRIAQLTQKTNQFNLTTRRYSDAEIGEYISSPEWLITHFSLQDIFGDSGIVGVALTHRINQETADLDSFLMSCRVIGRKAECAFLEATLHILRSRGIQYTVAQYVPTAKNKLVEDFYPEHGFTLQEDGRYYRNLESVGPGPEYLTTLPIDINIEGNRWDPLHESQPIA